MKSMKKMFVVLCVMVMIVSSAQATLVASWSLNEGSGSTAADSSGNSNTGILGGWGSYATPLPTWTTDAAPGVGGSYALNFSGNNTVLGGDSASLDVTRITLEAWVKLGATPDAYDVIVTKHNSYALSFDSIKRVGFNVLIGGTSYGIKASTLSLNEWHYVAGTYDGSTIKIYVDSTTPYNSTSVTGNIDATTTRFAIGSNIYGTSNNFNGIIDEVRISNVALSGSQLNIPEPATMLLLGSGAVALFRKKR